MKGLEERGWEDMLQRLNSTLPTHTKTGGSFRYVAVFVMILIFFSTSSYLTFKHFMLDDTSDTILPGSAAPERLAGHVDLYSSTNGIDLAVKTADESNNKDGIAVSKFAIEANYGVNNASKSARDVSNRINKSLKAHPDYTESISNVSFDGSMENGFTQNTHKEENAGIRTHQEGITKRSSGIEDIEKLLMAETELLSSVEQNSPVIALKSRSTDRRLAFSSILGAYSDIHGRYFGMDIAPQVDFKISKGTSVFFRLPIRFKHTLDNEIVRDVSNELNHNFEQKNLFLPDNLDIQSGKVNANTMDVNMVLGVSQRLGNKVALSTYGLCGYENVLGLIQAFSRIPEFSSTANIAYRTANTSIAAKRDGWVYGGGVEAEIKLGSRHSLIGGMNYYFNSDKSFEAGLGYRFRIY